MPPIAIKDFIVKESYFKLIQKKLITYLWEMIYKPMFKIASIKPEKATNSINPVLEGLRSGEIYYADGGFRAKTKFSNAQTKVLKEWGAKYSKWEKAYKIPYERIPSDVLVALSESQIITKMKINQIDGFLGDIEKNLPHIVENMVFHLEVEKIVDDAGREVKKNMKRVNIISEELTLSQKQEIAKTYTNNMQYYIKGWATDKIPEMRRKVQALTLQGYRWDKIQKMLESEYGIASRKAAFLARNETGIFLAAYKKSVYTKEGFDAFIWKTVMDGRERERHAFLNGTTWFFDNPPVIDEEGNTGLPGEAYNCRCTMVPIISNSSMKYETQLYNAKESAERMQEYSNLIQKEKEEKERIKSM